MKYYWQTEHVLAFASFIFSNCDGCSRSNRLTTPSVFVVLLLSSFLNGSIYSNSATFNRVRIYLPKNSCESDFGGCMRCSSVSSQYRSKWPYSLLRQNRSVGIIFSNAHFKLFTTQLANGLCIVNRPHMVSTGR